MRKNKLFTAIFKKSKNGRTLSNKSLLIIELRGTILVPKKYPKQYGEVNIHSQFLGFAE